MKTSPLLLATLLLAPTCFLPSCCSCNNTSPQDIKKQEAIINIEANPAKLDPRTAILTSDFNVIRTFSEGLFRVNKQGVVSPAIAESYKLSKDNKTYEITLKKTFWSNGDPVTAHDFTYAWRSLLAKDFASTNASFLFPIKNAKKIKEGLVPASELGAYADGDYKIIIELIDPIPFFIEFLSFPIYFPVHRYLDRQNPNWAEAPETYVCNGPFTFESWKHRDQITAKKNDFYWDKDNVKLQDITMLMLDENTAYNLFINKNLDHVGSPFSNLPIDSVKKHIEDGTIISRPFIGTFWIRTNINQGPLSNKHFRKALACSIDRKAIADHIFPGGITAAMAIVPPSMGLSKTPYFKDADNESALKHFKKALETTDLNKQDYDGLTLTYINTAANTKIVEAVQDGWRNTLGVSILLEPLGYKVFFDRVGKKKYQLAYSGNFAEYNDPISLLELFKDSTTGANRTGWVHPEYVKAIEASFKENNPEARATLLKKAEEIIMEDMPVIPMHHTAMTYLQNPALKDLVITETGIIDLKWAYFEDL
ncbi:MAG: Oligopeptide-binding protein OppA [Chlamydiia bacterium]|nr:Oligopeptide-binding protein OppA [Chlamydiia bacterium]MCH9618306.1 Oligopeptide-binding protein OppA [Chlamydiia bacterium]MCH9624179.1 Oligopeptide-binding protein OppA [Chlamydiia bacterium]